MGEVVAFKPVGAMSCTISRVVDGEEEPILCRICGGSHFQLTILPENRIDQRCVNCGEVTEYDNG